EDSARIRSACNSSPESDTRGCARRGEAPWTCSERACWVDGVGVWRRWGCWLVVVATVSAVMLAPASAASGEGPDALEASEDSTQSPVGSSPSGIPAPIGVDGEAVAEELDASAPS